MESTNIKYKKIKGFANTKGQTFEAKMVALIFLRGVNSGLTFRLGSNVAGAGALDDVVFQYKPRGQSTWSTCFVQMKHKESAWVTLRALTHAKGDFALVKYFESYRDIKLAMSSSEKQPFFDGSMDECTIVLFTNSKASSDLEEGRRVELGTAEEFLGSNTGSVYCFDADGNRKVDTAIFECLTESEDERKDFMKRLRVFCGQPSENGFDALIKDELRKIENVAIKQIDVDRLCECLVDNVSAWCEKSSNVIHGGSNLLDDALDRVIVEACYVRERGAAILDANFTDTALSPLRNVLKDNVSVCLVQSSESSTCLSCTKFLQAIEGSDLFLGTRCLLENQKAVLSEWRKGKLRYLAISTRDLTSENMRNFIDVVKEVCITSEGSDKKVLLFLDKNSEFVNALVKNLSDKLTMFVDTFEFSQLTDESKEKILRRVVSFQGHQTKLSDLLVDDGAADQAIDAASVVTILNNAGQLRVGPELPAEVSYYVPRTLEQVHMLKRTIFSVASLTEGMTIVHSSEKDILSIFWASEALNNPQRLREAYAKLCTFPFNLNDNDAAVSIGETGQLGNYECQCLRLRTSSNNKEISLRIRPIKRPSGAWFLFIMTGTNEEDVTVLSEFNNSKHWLSLKENLHWLKSQSKMDIIREHIDETQAVTVNTETMTQFSDRLVLLCAEPGMGKSTLMSRLARTTKQAHPYSWVVALSLNDHSQLFSQGKHNDALAFLSEVAGVKTELERALLKFSLDVTGNLVVLIDGFDEIAPKYVGQCCTLISNLLKTKAKKVWVTSRNSAKSYLEDHLSILAARIRGFDEADQRCFLKQFWAEKSTLPERELDDFIGLLLKSMTRAINEDFLGIPLQMRIVAEVYEDNVRGLRIDSTLPEKLNLLRLMEMFVEKKLLVYVQDKLNIKPDEPKYESQLKSNKKEFMKNHSLAALVLVLSSEDLKELHSKKILKKATEFFEEFLSCEDNTGIIDSIINDKPRFIHRVFAEYFVAKWLAEHLDENATFLQAHLNLPDFGVVRTIFDLTLAKDCELHTAVLNEDLEEVRTLINRGADVAVKDIGGRIALHLGSAFGPSEDQTVNIRRGEILEKLIANTKDFYIEESIYKATPLRYADMTQSWNAIDKLLPFYSDDCKRHLVDTLKNVSNRAMIVQICAHDLVNLLNVSLSEGLSFDIKADSEDARKLRLLMAQNGSSRVLALLVGILPTVADCSLHHAASLGDLESVKATLQTSRALESEMGNMSLSSKPEVTVSCDDKTLEDIVNKVDKVGWTALHHASFHGHVPVVEFLIAQGADVSRPDEALGYTPLHMGAGLGRPGVVTALLSAVKGEKKTDCLVAGNKEGRTALHLAVEMGHFDVVKMLVEAAGDAEEVQPPPTTDQESRTCTESRLESVEDVIKRNGKNVLDAKSVTVDGKCGTKFAKAKYINTRDTSGRTALHDAAWHANKVILSYLIVEGGDIRRGTNQNSTPLHWAASCGDAKTVKVLIDAVDEDGRFDFVNLLDNEGNNALHGAIWEGRLESVKLLIAAGGKVTVANHAGKTSLMVAVERGHRDIVALLLDGFVEKKEGMSKKDYIYMRNKNGRTVLDVASGDLVDAITGHVSEAFDFDVD